METSNKTQQTEALFQDSFERLTRIQQHVVAHPENAELALDVQTLAANLGQIQRAWPPLTRLVNEFREACATPGAYVVSARDALRDAISSLSEALELASCEGDMHKSMVQELVSGWTNARIALRTLERGFDSSDTPEAAE